MPIRCGNGRRHGMGRMPHTAPPTSVRPSSRLRLTSAPALGLCLAAILATLGIVLVNLTSALAMTPFTPGTDDGLVPAGDFVGPDDDRLPAIARVDPVLLDALRAAAADAAQDGIALQVTSGWRSAQYQQWLLDDAIETYASEQVARQFVATPDASKHVTGDALDIGPIDAQFWLIEHGYRYGLCQIYANERWHFERATEPGGVCPELKEDATS